MEIKKVFPFFVYTILHVLVGTVNSKHSGFFLIIRKTGGFLKGKNFPKLTRGGMILLDLQELQFG